MNVEVIRALRATAQRLDAQRGEASAAEVTRHMVALQAQDLAAASLGVGVRADRLTLAMVNHVRNVDRSIVRVWCLRGTLHLVAAEDVRWLLELVRSRLGTANRRRRAELGLDDKATALGVRLVTESLAADGPLSRLELAERLRQHGIAYEGQATFHVIWRAAMDGLVCYGPDRAGEETFVLLDDWLAAKPTNAPADAPMELGRRYLAAYGPATRDDFAAWSGLSGSDIRRVWVALNGEATSVSTPFGEMLVHPNQATGDSVVRLLPAFDAVWHAYRDHRVELEPHLAKRVFPGGGVVRPLVFKSGCIVGTWARRSNARGGTDLTVNLFEPVEPAVLEPAVAQYGVFAARAAQLVKQGSGG